jgi:hypothetical protein
MINKWGTKLYFIKFYTIYVIEKLGVLIYLNNNFLLILIKDHVPKYCNPVINWGMEV